MQFVPWRQVASWRCTSCGHCCRDYAVVLKFPEYLKITQTFGSDSAVMGVNRLFLKRVEDGRCAFLCRYSNGYLCGLQNMKPQACKIWPFKVLAEPKYGEPKEAVYDFGGAQLYVYVDRHCSGLRYGSPTWEFSNLTLKEFASLAIGGCDTQRNSTRKRSSL